MSDTSPRIIGESWGNLEVEGQGTFKDAKLWPGGARDWNWNENGTDHRPGIQPGDVQELVDHGAQVIILSQGRRKALKVPDATVEAARAAGAEVKVLPTDKAIEEYNRLAQDKRVGALIHSTC
jgi:hypothetical protein